MARAATDFVTSVHGFPFPNWYPPGTPILRVPTPLGPLLLGDANGGVCGGMVFAALDYYLFGQTRPARADGPVLGYFARRLLDSWNMPFGVLKYYDGQRRPGASRSLAGVRLLDGLSRLNVVEEWPKIRQAIDAGLPAALGLVKARSYDPRQLARNHQVLAHGYELAEDGGRVSIQIYDPNYPNDDTATLTLSLTDPDADTPVVHSCEGPSVRGLFLTEYARPAELPTW